MPLLFPVIAGLLAGGVFGHRRPDDARRLVAALDRSGATRIINMAALTVVPVGHPIAAALKIVG
ncbi:MAG: hypothetical protein R3F60_21535 [bacterium]